MVAWAPMRALMVVVFFGCGSSHHPAAAPPAPAPMPAHDHGPAAPPALTIAAIADGAAIMPGLGDHHRAVTTKSGDAQAFFDQGLRLVYGFNHDEAARSFARATV